MGLTAIVLGAAAGGGFPQWNCNCAVCRLAWAGDGRVRARTQASLAVSADGERWSLLNAAPDLRAQVQATAALHPRGGSRGSPVACVVLTGAEIDQTAGLLSLRERSPFTLIATAATLAAVAGNPMFGVLAADVVTRRAVAPGERFALGAGLDAELFMVPGKLPLYLEGEDPDTASESAANVGVELSSGTARLAYVPGAAAVTPALRQRLSRADAILFDGTLYRDDEMIRTGTGEKTGRRMGHMPIDGPDGSLAALDGLSARRIFVHVNNTNPILVDGSPERARVEAAGWQVAWDGMEISL
jgi:pyrroloquinoline quinone biosynthesis protein B